MKEYIEQDMKKLVSSSLGACLATDKITVDGERVRLMYREPTDEGMDSGWRFTAGTEDQEYMDDPSNSGIFDVNTIANLDPTIIPYLKAPAETAWELDDETGKFVRVEY